MKINDGNNSMEGQNAEDSGTTSVENQICTTSIVDDMTNLPEVRVVVNQRPSFSSFTSYSGEHGASSVLPYLFINRPEPMIMPPATAQPLRIFSRESPLSVNLLPNQPQSLFLQALSKLNESSISLAVINHLRNVTFSPNQSINNMCIGFKSSELTTPNSLTSAPPSYSFVLRQMALRRRPRLMGTFIPSPSFVQQTPPPNYAAAFDIYVDNHIPTAPARVYHFGFTPVPIVCPECGYTGPTLITSKITLCTHLCAIMLCLFCCWVCAPLPYVLRSCKDVYHYCRNCRNFLGMYCPTNPENASAYR